MLQLRREGNFPFLLWKDTAPQHFESTFGEYPQVRAIRAVLTPRYLIQCCVTRMFALQAYGVCVSSR